MQNEEQFTVKTELITMFEDCGGLLSAIGDENRQRIIVSLIRNPGQRVEDIRKCTDLSRPAVSHHLKVLKDASMVTIVKKGTMNFYFPNCESEIWNRLFDLASMIRDTAKNLTENGSLEDRRRVLIDELDD